MSMLTFVKKFLVLTCITAVTMLHADFFVIPVVRKIQNIVTVGKSGAQFTDVKKALDSITDANSTNPYLIVVGPGRYEITETLELKPYISITGSGMYTTVLSGAISGNDTDDGAIIATNGGSSISHLSIENRGGSESTAAGIYFKGDNPIAPTIDGYYGISDVSVKVSGGTYSAIGIENYDVDWHERNLAIDVTNSALCYGIRNRGWISVTLSNIYIRVSNCSDENYGLYDDAIATSSLSDLDIMTEGKNSYAIYSGKSNDLFIHNCRLDGETAGIYGAKAMWSIVNGGGAGGAVCHDCFDSTYKALESNCSLP